MKKLFALMLAMGMVFSAAPAMAADIRVGMITDYGDITDQSFNQMTYQAGKAYCEANGYDFTYYKPAAAATADRVAMVDKAVADGYDVLLMPGYAFAETVVESAEMYPDVKFVVLDVTQADLDAAYGGPYTSENVFCASYAGELGGYMAADAVIRMGYTKVGFLGGMAVPGVVHYGYGFVKGCEDAAAKLGVDVTVNYAYGNQFYGDADITAVMDTWYSQGIEAVFACGGGIYTSAAEAAIKTGGKVIGVDSDQAPIIDGQYGEGVTLTSAMKGLDVTINVVLDAIVAGEWDTYAGQCIELGVTDGENPENNYMQLPIESTQFNDTYTVEDYKAVVADMASGAIDLSSVDYTADEPTASGITLNYQGNIK